MAFPTTGLLDALTGTNGDDLNVYSASWASPPTGANSLEIQGNAATATVDLAYAANMWATTYGPDVEIYAPIDTLPATGVPIMLLARCQQETSMATVDGYALYYQPGSLRISRVDNGALTDLTTAAITLAAGDLIGLEIIGSTLKAYRFTSSWAEVLSTTDTTYSAAGKIGLYSYGNTVRIGALYGGTVVATPTFSVQPQSQSAASGGTVTFNCTVADATSLQWETAPITSLYSDVPGTWSNASGTSTVEDYTTGTLSSSDNGKWYRLKASNASGDTYSEPVRVWITGLGISGRGLAGGRFVRRPWLKRRRAGSASPFIKAIFPGDEDTTETTVFTDWLFGTPASGSTTYNETLSASVAPGDALLAGLLFSDSVSDSTTLSDSVSPNLVVAYPLAETVATSEAFSTQAAFASAISDAITAGETMSAGAVYVASMGESIAPADSIPSGLFYAVTISEPATAGDTVATSLILGASVLEAISAGEGLTTQATMADSLSEGAAFAAALTPQVVASFTLSDSVSLADSFEATVSGGAQTYNESITEALSVVDSILGVATYSSAFTEALSAGDVFDVQVVLATTLAEAFAASDALGATQVFVANVGEGIVLAEVLSVSGDSLVWPDPADVAAGVQYGPTGTEYTGTKLGGGAFLRRR